MGIVINKTLNSIDFRDLLEELDIPTDPTTRNITVHFGGPVENQRGFVLHSLDYEHEAEFQENAWLSVPANETLLFDVPNDDKWERAFNSIGVDLSVLSSSSGRA